MSCFEDTLRYSSPAHGGWGLIRVVTLVPESYMLFTCPADCFRHGALGAVQHGYKDRIAYIYIEKSDIINAYDELIKEGARELLERLRKTNRPVKALFLYVSCLDDFIGTDMDHIARELDDMYEEVDIRAGHMNPVMSDTKYPPLVTGYHNMLDVLKGGGEKKNTISIFGNLVPLPEDSDLVRFLKRTGIKDVLQIGNCRTYEEYQAMADSPQGLVMSPFGEYGVTNMKRRTGMETLSIYVSYDIDEIGQEYDRLKEFLQYAGETGLDEVEESARLMIRRTRDIVGDIPVIISDSATRFPFRMAAALLKYGFRVAGIYAQEVNRIDRDAYDDIAQNHPDIWVRQPQAYRFAQNPIPHEMEIVIGLEGAYLEGASRVVKLAEDEGLFGYRGLICLMEMLNEARLHKSDLKQMILDYGGVV